MRTIRIGTFETNSSSTHSITMCMESDFLKWKNGEMYWNRWNDELVSKETVEEEFLKENTGVSKEDPDFKDKLEEYLNDDDKTYYTYEEFNGYDYIEYETYVDKYNTPNGDTVVAFGYYGQDY
jgi:hypothetical protein